MLRGEVISHTPYLGVNKHRLAMSGRTYQLGSQLRRLDEVTYNEKLR
jgi:hypothetical protein